MNEQIEIQPVTFEELKTLFQKKIFAIPEIQREFVWTKTKIIEFLDSIRKQYPIGSFLICKVPAKMAMQIRECSALPAFDPQVNSECYIVVDGQQRLSVLYSILQGQTIKETLRYQHGINFNEICISPKAGRESEFDFYKLGEGSHVKLHDILTGSWNHNLNKNKEKRVEECRKAFETYSFPFILISEYDPKKMREAFIRLNRGGTPLSSVDRIFALSYQKDVDFRRHCDHLSHELKRGFDSIDRIHFVRSIAANLGVTDFSGSLTTFAKKIRNPKNDLHKKYRKNSKKIRESVKLSADFLTQRVKHASYLPYPAMLSILSIFYYHNNNISPTNKQVEEIDKWFWITGFTKRYSGTPQKYNQMNDAQEMKNLAENKNYQINLEGKRRIEPVSLNLLEKIQYNKPGALGDTFFCYLINKKPLYFINGEPLQIEEVSSTFNVKNDHHIFPKELLKGHISPNEINSIVNICFLTFGENIKIKDKPPWTYLKPFEQNSNFSQIMKSHVLPIDDSLMIKGNVPEKFKEFRIKRMSLIKKDVIGMIGKKYVRDY